MREKDWWRALVVMLLLLPGLVAHAANPTLTVKVPYEVQITPKSGNVDLECRLADGDCKVLDSRKKVVKLRGKPPHKGSETFQFTGDAVTKTADVMCRLSSSDLAINSVKSVLPGADVQCSNWMQTVSGGSVGGVGGKMPPKSAGGSPKQSQTGSGKKFDLCNDPLGTPVCTATAGPMLVNGYGLKCNTTGAATVAVYKQISGKGNGRVGNITDPTGKVYWDYYQCNNGRLFGFGASGPVSGYWSVDGSTDGRSRASFFRDKVKFEVKFYNYKPLYKSGNPCPDKGVTCICPNKSVGCK